MKKSRRTAITTFCGKVGSCCTRGLLESVVCLLAFHEVIERSQRQENEWYTNPIPVCFRCRKTVGYLNLSLNKEHAEGEQQQHRRVKLEGAPHGWWFE